MGGSQFHSKLGSRIFDAIYWLVNYFEPTWRLMNWGLVVLARRRTQAAIDAFGPDVVVSTYPASTLMLGELRARGLLGVPAVSAITDLAALRSWTHPAIDLNLITHPESTAEVRGLAPASEIRAVSGFTSPGFERELDQAAAREALDLPARGRGDRGLGRRVGGRRPRGGDLRGAGDARRDGGLPGGAQRGGPRGARGRVRRRAPSAGARIHGPDRGAVRGSRRARALDRRANGARGADHGLPGDLLRLGPRPRPGKQPSLQALRPRPGRDRPRAAAGGAGARPATPRRPERALAELPPAAESVYELAA